MIAVVVPHDRPGKGQSISSILTCQYYPRFVVSLSYLDGLIQEQRSLYLLEVADEISQIYQCERSLIVMAVMTGIFGHLIYQIDKR